MPELIGDILSKICQRFEIMYFIDKVKERE